MTDQPENQLTHWQNLKTQAENGELVMEADIAGKLAQRCDTFIGQLNDAIDKVYDLQYVSGFGGLRSATQLAQKFANKAVSDEDSAVNRLKLSVQIGRSIDRQQTHAWDRPTSSLTTVTGEGWAWEGWTWP